MGLTVLIPPSVEPLTLSEAKKQCEITDTDHDDLLQAYIVAAPQWCESYTRRTIPATTHKLTLDRFPACNQPIRLPVPPITAVSSIGYTDQNGNAQVLTPVADYLVDLSGEPARVTPAFSKQWPATRDQINSVSVTFTAGYSSVPEGIKHAMKMLVSGWFENREAMADKASSPVPFGVEALLDSFRWGSYV